MGKRTKVLWIDDEESAAVLHSVNSPKDLGKLPPERTLVDVGPHRFTVYSGSEGAVFDVPIGAHLLFYPVVFCIADMPKLTESKLRKMIVEAAIRNTEEESEEESEDEPPPTATEEEEESDHHDEDYYDKSDTDEEDDDFTSEEEEEEDSDDE
jgi:hypothetical protein